MRGGGLGCVDGWKLDVGVRFVLFGATDGQRGVESVKTRMILVMIGEKRILLEAEGGGCGVGKGQGLDFKGGVVDPILGNSGKGDVYPGCSC